MRVYRQSGKEPTNVERREIQAAEKAAAEGGWTFDKPWNQWKAVNATKKGIVNDENRYKTHIQGPFGNKEPKDVVPFDVNRQKRNS